MSEHKYLFCEQISSYEISKETNLKYQQIHKNNNKKGWRNKLTFKLTFHLNLD